MKKPLICGIDECGRGCLAGPVVASAVLYDPDLNLPVGDSKGIKAKERERLASLIQAHCPYGIGWVWQWEIDEINIHNASLLAMQRAYLALGIVCDEALVDGKFAPVLGIPTRAIIKGDASVPCISAGSLVAKVARDKFMSLYHKAEPDYGFDRHKGYATPYHTQAIHKLGNSSLQRLSFRVPSPPSHNLKLV